MRDQAEWVGTASSPVLPATPLDASVSLPMFLVLVWPRTWTLMLLLGVMVFLIILQMKGRDGFWILLSIKSKLRGRKLYSRPVWYRRRMQRLSPVTDIIES